MNFSEEGVRAKFRDFLKALEPGERAFLAVALEETFHMVVSAYPGALDLDEEWFRCTDEDFEQAFDYLMADDEEV